MRIFKPANKTSKSDKNDYPGILAEPMPKCTALTGPTGEEIDALIDSKFKALFAHYEIDAPEALESRPKDGGRMGESCLAPSTQTCPRLPRSTA